MYQCVILALLVYIYTAVMLGIISLLLYLFDFNVEIFVVCLSVYCWRFLIFVSLACLTLYLCADIISHRGAGRLLVASSVGAHARREVPWSIGVPQDGEVLCKV